MSIMTLMKQKNPIFATVETFFFFLVLTPLYVFLAPCLYTYIAKWTGYVETSWPQGNIWECFSLTRPWVYAVQAILYLPLVTFYWAPGDKQANEAEVTGLSVFVLLLPLTVYVFYAWSRWAGWPPAEWFDWNSVPRLVAGIRLSALAVACVIAGGVLFWVAAQHVVGIPAKGYGQYFTAYLASWALGIAAGSLAAIILFWATRSAWGPANSKTAGYIFGTAVCVLNQWAAIHEMLGTTYKRTIPAWLVPFGVTALAVWLFNVQAMVLAVIS